MIIQTRECVIASDRCFFGNQPDDFGLAGLVEGAKSICMLGMGLGSGALSASRLAPHARVVAVEVDPDVAALQAEIFRSYFPDVHVEVHVEDAAMFVARGGVFDVVCVDLFTQRGFPSFYFDREFWSAIHAMTHADGLVLANVWGFPLHLGPMSGDSPQREVGGLLTSLWPDVRRLTHRRNVTFAATSSATLRTPPTLGGETDNLVAALLPTRWRYAPAVTVCENGEPAPSFDERKLNAAFVERTRAFAAEVHRLTGTALTLDARGSARASALPLLRDRRATAGIVYRLLEAGAPELAAYVPTSLASYLLERECGLDWFLGWVTTEAEDLMAADPAWFIDIVVWQALSVLASPLAAPRLRTEHTAAYRSLVSRVTEIASSR